MINKIPLYVLNNFLKIEKKLYQVFGLQLGRPLRLKAILYFLVIGVIEIVIYNLPIIGNLINWMPLGILIIIPGGLAWLLADVGTEGRSPIHFFRSFISYQKRKFFDKATYYRGKEIKKENNYQFRNYFTYSEAEPVFLNAGHEFASEVKEDKEKDSHVNKVKKNKRTKKEKVKKVKPVKKEKVTKEKKFKVNIPKVTIPDVSVQKAKSKKLEEVIDNLRPETPLGESVFDSVGEGTKNITKKVNEEVKSIERIETYTKSNSVPSISEEKEEEITLKEQEVVERVVESVLSKLKAEQALESKQQEIQEQEKTKEVITKPTTIDNTKTDEERLKYNEKVTKLDPSLKINKASKPKKKEEVLELLSLNLDDGQTRMSRRANNQRRRKLF